MTPKTGSPPLYLAISETGKTQEAEKIERLREVITTLDRCRSELIDSSDRETLYLFNILMLQLQTRAHRIGEAELMEFCAALAPAAQPESGLPKTLSGGSP